MVSELKDQNGTLKKEKDDLNRMIQEQSQQMTGTQTSSHKSHSLTATRPSSHAETFNCLLNHTVCFFLIF